MREWRVECGVWRVECGVVLWEPMHINCTDRDDRRDSKHYDFSGYLIGRVT